ncbi:MAG: hypothetical protein NTW98_03125 [Candidatus Nomurabacteria bacterium]|nr:hypothetical protein [Candidatus Nomurabacteria bacterium]
MALNPTFNTPILLIVFNRPEETTKLWAEIKKLKPKKLYVAADGPRPNNNGDMIKCMQTREIVTKGLDWDCDMKLMFQEHNLGCGIAIKEALMWFFKNEPEGIILEDDCIPHQDFFSFCASLLEKYRYEEKVFMICGNNINNNS